MTHLDYGKLTLPKPADDWSPVPLNMTLGELAELFVHGKAEFRISARANPCDAYPMSAFVEWRKAP